jgi:NAD(P)-dependent dehydrogenase (short-subunit alcohol dehydrogenase family)
MLLKDKVALVTGGGRGIGEAHSLRLAAAGATVVVNDLGGSSRGDGADSQVAAELIAQINAGDGHAVADGRDISSWEEAHRLVEDVIGRFGGLDIVVNNAGICRTTAFGSIEEADWDKLMDVNAKGTAAVINAAARHWRKVGPSAGRAIVNTASPQGAHPLAPIGVYSATKAAVLALTQVAAIELAELGVRVNALAPIARTRMVGEVADAELIMPKSPDFDTFLPGHVAEMVHYLVSPLCPFTGRVFGIQGDNAFLLSEWDARHRVNNAGKSWTAEALAARFAEFPLQDQRYMVTPDPVFPSPSPPDATLNALRIV